MSLGPESSFRDKTNQSTPRFAIAPILISFLLFLVPLASMVYAVLIIRILIIAPIFLRLTQGLEAASVNFSFPLWDTLNKETAVTFRFDIIHHLWSFRLLTDSIWSSAWVHCHPKHTALGDLNKKILASSYSNCVSAALTSSRTLTSSRNRDGGAICILISKSPYP